MIKQAATEAGRDLGVGISRIYLFGSRAREEAGQQSDWDLLIVVQGALDREAHRRLFLDISERLARLGIPADILIRTESQMAQAQTRVFSSEKIAVREGGSVNDEFRR
jgi:predicted nucleotidyltransferase